MSVLDCVIKDPEAILDYTIDWSEWLPEGDTLAAATWTVPAGLTLDSQSNTEALATGWLSGGLLGSTYVVTCHITTAAGRQDDRSLRVRIQNR
jgi:hypothetical protein